MQEFQPLIDEHKDIYEVINKLKTTFESTDKYKIIDEIRNFKSLLDLITKVHFIKEEEILLPKLKEKINNEPDLIECVLNEHKKISEKKELFDELFYKYEINPTDVGYEALIQITDNLADILYNHAYVEDMTIFAFSGIVLNDEEKIILAKELAKTTCELNKNGDLD